MLCEICQEPAAGWCESCGEHFCAEHGGARCCRCGGSFVHASLPTALRSDDIFTTQKESRPQHGKGYLQCHTRPEIPTIYLDDPEPPACAVCGGLARKICHHCQGLYCLEHGSANDLCRDCARSSWLGIILFGCAGLLLLALLLFGMLVEQLS